MTALLECNVVILSNQSINKFFAYKIGKYVGQCYINTDNCNIFNTDIATYNVWTEYENQKNAYYIIILQNIDEKEYVSSVNDTFSIIKECDPEYKFVLFINNINKLNKILGPYLAAWHAGFREYALNISHQESFDELMDIIKEIVMLCELGENDKKYKKFVKKIKYDKIEKNNRIILDE
jgi:hypothetical protein